MIRYHVTVSLHVNAARPNVGAVRLRVTWSRRRLDLFPGVSIPPAKWDRSACRMRPNCVNANGETAGELNARIEAALEEVRRIFTRAEIDNSVPEAEDVRKSFLDFIGRSRPSPSSFFDVYDRFVRTVGIEKEWTAATYQKFAALRRRLQAYESGLDLERLSESDLNGFVAYLHRCGLRNTTAMKYVEFLRWFLRWAHAHGYTQNLLHETFRPRLKGGDGTLRPVVYLTWEELQTLLSWDFSARPALSAVRDVFCFCAFTGLRYSDVAKLRRDDIHDGCVHVVTQKTLDPITIELNRYSSAILDKWEGVELPGGHALPVISNQKMNDRLKEIGRICGFDTPVRMVYFIGSVRHEVEMKKYELLSTHCARRSFVVNALRLGVPAEVVMKWTGHASFSSMRPYVQIVDESKRENMAKFDSFSGADEGPKDGASRERKK